MFKYSETRRLISKLALMLARWRILFPLVRLIDPRTRSKKQPSLANIYTVFEKKEFITTDLDFIVSAYKFQAHLADLARNIQGLKNKSRANFVFVLCQPTPDEEHEIVKLCKTIPTSLVMKTIDRISVYDAWNIAIQNSHSPLISNFNVDDLRDSDCIQTALTSIGDSDVLYSDLYLSKTKASDWITLKESGMYVETAAFDLETLVIDRLNFPHAAPFWKREVHAENGLFDPRMESSGDTEFWLRLLLKGKKFKRVPKPLYGYYQNPDGLSTKFFSVGASEWARVLQDNQTSIRRALKTIK